MNMARPLTVTSADAVVNNHLLRPRNVGRRGVPLVPYGRGSSSWKGGRNPAYCECHQITIGNVPLARHSRDANLFAAGRPHPEHSYRTELSRTVEGLRRYQTKLDNQSSTLRKTLQTDTNNQRRAAAHCDREVVNLANAASRASKQADHLDHVNICREVVKVCHNDLMGKIIYREACETRMIGCAGRRSVSEVEQFFRQEEHRVVIGCTPVNNEQYRIVEKQEWLSYEIYYRALVYRYSKIQVKNAETRLAQAEKALMSATKDLNEFNLLVGEIPTDDEASDDEVEAEDEEDDGDDGNDENGPADDAEGSSSDREPEEEVAQPSDDDVPSGQPDEDDRAVGNDDVEMVDENSLNVSDDGSVVEITPRSGTSNHGSDDNVPAHILDRVPKESPFSPSALTTRPKQGNSSKAKL
jgi:hypothetical protein